VKQYRRLLPFVLVGALTLGAGLGVGLGVSEGPVTVNHTGAKTAQTLRCTTSVARGEADISCSSPSTTVSGDTFFGGEQETIWFRSTTSVSKGWAACMEAVLQSNLRRYPIDTATSASGELRRGALVKPASTAALRRYARSSQASSLEKSLNSALTSCGVAETRRG